jgi:hypothetical protein
MEPSLPFTASAFWTLSIFLIGLAVFHLFLVVIVKLDNVSWKKVDYIWLGLTALSLLTASSEVRRLVATNLTPSEMIYHDSAYERLRYQANFMRSGAVCLEFGRSELSTPDFDESQAQFRKVCEYGRRLYASLPTKPPGELGELKLPVRPTVSDESLLNYYKWFDDTLSEYAQAEHQFRKLKAATEKTDTEEMLVFFAPIFLAVGLALRVTKVTGEIQLERAKIKASVEKRG